MVGEIILEWGRHHAGMTGGFTRNRQASAPEALAFTLFFG